MIRLFRLTLLVLILLSAFTLSAQDDDTTTTCSPELINMLRELKSAEADAQQGNVTQNLDDIQAQIAEIRAICSHDRLDLPQSITSEESDFSFPLTVQYPAGWVGQEDFGVIYLADSQEMLDLIEESPDITPDLEEDTVAVVVVGLNSEFLSLFFEDGDVVTPVSVLEVTLLGDNNEGLNFEPIQIEFLNDRPAASVIAVGTNTGELARVFAISVEMDDGYVLVTAVTNPNETDFDDTVRAIAASVEATFTDSE